MAEAKQTTLDQKRAHHALRRVSGHCGDKIDYKKEYRSYVRSLPLQITMSGLGQTIAQQFAGASRDGRIGQGHEAVLSDVLSWIGSHQHGWTDTPYRNVNFNKGDNVKAKTKTLLDAIMAGDEQKMLRAQFELMAYLKWLKTFAEAMIDPDEKPSKSGGKDG